MLRERTSYLRLATYFRVVSSTLPTAIKVVSIVYDLFLWNDCMVAIMKEGVWLCIFLVLMSFNFYYTLISYALSLSSSIFFSNILTYNFFSSVWDISAKTVFLQFSRDPVNGLTTFLHARDRIAHF